MKKYVFPLLSNKESLDMGYVRLGGNGLANCLFVVARAYLISKSENLILISPTWRKISLGPFLRRERDKRLYHNLFLTGGISGLKKLLLIKVGKDKVKFVKGLGNYFLEFRGKENLVRFYILSIINKQCLKLINKTFLKDKIAIHVRLGDYCDRLRISLDWYKNIVQEILKYNPEQEFVLFSDGEDEELSSLTELKCIKRVFYGNALADIIAMSNTKLVIASDSTFSAWGAFLGDIPIVFNRRHFPPVYGNGEKEFIYPNSLDIRNTLIKLI